MPIYGFVYIIAVFTVAYLSSLPSLSLLCVALIFIAFIAVVLNRDYCKGWSKIKQQVFKVLVVYSVAFMASAFHGHYLLSRLFDDTAYSRICEVSGIVYGIVEYPNYPTNNVTRFKLNPSEVKCNAKTTAAHIIDRETLSLDTLSLSLYGKRTKASPVTTEFNDKRNSAIIDKIQPVINAGDRLRLLVKLKTPRSNFSEGVFDFKRWAINNGISATGYVRKVLAIEKDVRRFAALRDYLTGHIQQQPISQQAKASLHALLLGNKSELSDRQWQWLRATGTVHLLVVSGLHIGIAVAIGWWLGMAISCLLRLVSVSWSNTLIPEISALSLSFGYVMLSGAGLSTQRAWLMAFILLMANSFSYSFSLWQRWWLALIIIISWQPLSVLEPGLWLSFLAVASLICLQGLRDQRPKWSLILSSQFAVWFALTPLLLLFFQQVSLISPLANIFAISYISLLIILLVPVMVVSLFDFSQPLELLAVLIDYFWEAIEQLATVLDWAVIEFSPLDQGAILLIAIASLCLLLPISIKLKALSLSVWLILVFPKYAEKTPLPNHFRLTLIDVGQGLAVLVQTHQHTLLYDTGAGFPSGFNYFERNIKPLLDKRRIASLDRLVISHTDNDHSGGLKYAQQQMVIEQLDSEISSLPDVPYSPCKSGASWQWGGVEFHYRHSLVAPNAKPNNRSCVLQIANRYCKVLIMGDAQKKVELKLLPNSQESLHSVLVAGHHGSNTSTSAEFLAREKFQTALISSGYANRYRHPHPKVIERLANKRIDIYRTDLQGSIDVQSIEHNAISGCLVTSFKAQHKRYWW